MPGGTSYANDGMGRDKYIGINNGGLSCDNGVQCAPLLGAFNEKKKSDFLDHSLAHIPSRIQIIKVMVEEEILISLDLTEDSIHQIALQNTRKVFKINCE